MRIVEKLLYGICGIIGLMLLFILLCHLNPSLAKGFAKNVEAKGNEENAVETIKEMAPNLEEEIQNIEIGNEVLGTSDYEIPSESTLEIPNIMLALMSMELPTGTRTDVSEKRAEELKQDLTKGDLGENLTYDKVFYPYYYMLSDNEQSLYKQIHANANDLLKKFAPFDDSVSATELQRAFTAVINDHPELFWLNTGYGYYMDPSKKIVEIDLNYNFTANDIEKHKDKFEKAAEEIVYGSRGANIPYEKEKYVHNALAKNIVYDLQAPANQSAYSALVTNRTVCAGYARAFQYIMQKLEIPTYYCTGYSGENHAWNIIKLDDGYYNVDVTWDDQMPLIYDYFNKSDAEYKKDHVRRDMAVNLPPCLGEKYSGLEKNEKQEKPESEAVTPSENNVNKVEEADKVAADALNKIPTSPVTKEEVTVTITPSKKLDYHLFDNEDEYYLECAYKMMEDGDSNISFDIYLKDEETWNIIKKAYVDGSFKNKYMDRVLAEQHAKGANVSVTGQVMADGTVKVSHKYKMY